MLVLYTISIFISLISLLYFFKNEELKDKPIEVKYENGCFKPTSAISETPKGDVTIRIVKPDAGA